MDRNGVKRTLQPFELMRVIKIDGRKDKIKASGSLFKPKPSTHINKHAHTRPYEYGVFLMLCNNGRGNERRRKERESIEAQHMKISLELIKEEPLYANSSVAELI